MPTQQKIEKVGELINLFRENKVHIIADHSGLNVEDINRLRREIRKNGARMIVAKNRLIARARADIGLVPIDSVLDGPTSIILSIDDPVAPAKVLKKFIDEVKMPKIKGLVIGKEFFSASRFESIATMPGLNELRARLLGGMSAPLIGLVSVKSGLLRGLVVVLNAVKAKKSAA